jgi:hypothetical protein
MTFHSKKNKEVTHGNPGQNYSGGSGHGVNRDHCNSERIQEEGEEVMTAQAAIKRNEKAQWLRTWQVDSSTFYCESEDGKIAYKCGFTDNGEYCTCADYVTNSKKDPNFKCKHILSVLNCIPKDEVLEAKFMDKRKPKLDERFIKQVEGRDFVLYSGLLDLAHQLRLISMEVELLEQPSEENKYTAVCRATARTSTGGLFVDYGDANAQNCNQKVAKHLIRMASTRAKARCLRDLTNVGMTALEELGDYSEVIGEEIISAQQKDNVRKLPGRQAKATNESNPAAEPAAKSEAKPVTAQELPNKPDDYPKETGQVNASQEGVNTSQAQAPVDKPVDTDKQAFSKPAKPSNGNGKSRTEVKLPLMSEAQKNAIYNLSRRRNISVEELENLAIKTFNAPLNEFTSADASQFIRTLQTAA